MLGKQLIVLRYVAVVEIRQTEVEEDVKKVGKLRDREIKSVRSVAHEILDRYVDAQNPERFDQKIDKQ